MIHVIPFKAEHAVALKDFMSLLQVHDPMVYGQVLEADPLSFSALKGDRIIGAAGIHTLHPGVGRAWALLSPEVRGAPFFLHREVKRRLPLCFRLGEYHRVEITVRTDFPVAAAWAEKLGFQHEGVLLMYGPEGADYHSYSITKKTIYG